MAETVCIYPEEIVIPIITITAEHRTKCLPIFFWAILSSFEKHFSKNEVSHLRFKEKETADLVTFTEEVLTEEIIFCSVKGVILACPLKL